MSLVWLIGVALAAPEDADPDDDDLDLPSTAGQKTDEGWGFEKQTSKLEQTVDDDEGMHDFVADAKKKAPPPVWWHLDPRGKGALHDDFDIQIDAYNDEFLLVELPVVVATDRASFTAAHPGGIVLIAEITSGALRRVVSEIVAPEAVFDAAPTLVFLKTALPTPAKTGEVRFLVKVGELPAPPPAPVEGAKAKADA
ncbi:MAG: hypothetical protein ABMB14_39430, partial [Myxococcota bacterium]